MELVKEFPGKLILATNDEGADYTDWRTEYIGVAADIIVLKVEDKYQFLILTKDRHMNSSIGEYKEEAGYHRLKTKNSRYIVEEDAACGEEALIAKDNYERSVIAEYIGRALMEHILG